MYFKRNMERRKEEVIEHYHYMIKGLREHAKMKRRFNEKVNAAMEQYEQYLDHLRSEERV